jgi:hypothetical protein
MSPLMRLTTSASEKSNSGLGDAMDAVSQNLSVSLFTNLANHFFLLFRGQPLL